MTKDEISIVRTSNGFLVRSAFDGGQRFSSSPVYADDMAVAETPAALAKLVAEWAAPIVKFAPVTFHDGDAPIALNKASA